MPSMPISPSLPTNVRLDRPKAIEMLKQGLKSQKISLRTKAQARRALKMLRKAERRQGTPT